MGQRIGVLGSGIVAKTLAKGFRDHGHEVRIGSRDASKVAATAAEVGATPGTFADVAGWADVVVLAVKGTAALDALKLVGADKLAGKTVIDTTNPIADLPPVKGVLQFFTGPNDSLMERLQAAYPAARFVKAFSCVGNAFMVDPKLPGGPPTMFVCGDDDAAKAQVAGFLRDFGWDVADMGAVESARAIEPLCQLWCVPGLRGGPWTHAFKLLRA
jgi:hypothetical protein